MIDILSHNREAWDKQAADGSRWTLPVDAARIARARAGGWTVDLTPRKPVPREWFGDLKGARVLRPGACSPASACPRCSSSTRNSTRRG